MYATTVVMKRDHLAEGFLHRSLMPKAGGNPQWKRRPDICDQKRAFNSEGFGCDLTWRGMLPSSLLLYIPDVSAVLRSGLLRVIFI